MMRMGFAVVLLLIPALAGCVDQRAEVDAYRGLIDTDAPAITLSDGQPLTLEDALRLSVARNERLSIEGEAYLRSTIDRQRAAASILPTLDAFGNLTFRDRTGGGSDMPEGGGTASRSTLFDGGLRGQYFLLTGLTDFRQVDAAKLTIEQRHWLLLDVRETLVLDTARAYYGVLLAERLVGVIESSLAVQEERLRDIRGRQEVGFSRPLDVAQIEAQTSETRVTLLDARTLAATTRSLLGFLINADVADRALTDGFTPPPPVTLDELGALAQANRQDLAAAEARAGAARVRVDAEIGRYFPSVSVNLDYFLTRDTAPSDRDWSGLLSVNFPIFSAGRIDADVRAAWSLFREAVLSHSLTRRSMQRDVEIAQVELSASVTRVNELGNQVRAAEEALRQAEAAYAAGLGTNLERITAQDQLLAAQVRQAREEFASKVAYLAAMRAAGVLTRVATGEQPDPSTLPPRREPPESPFLNLPQPAAAARP